MQAIAVVWMQSVHYFADPDAARGLVASAWWQVTMPLMVRLRFPSRPGAQTLTLLTAWCPQTGIIGCVVQVRDSPRDTRSAR